MKILRIISTMHPSSGGPCQGIRNSIGAQRLLGVENEVVCFDDAAMDYGTQDDFIIHKIGPAKGPYAYAPKFKEWLSLNASQYDAIVIHGLWLYNNYGTYKILGKLKAQKSNKVPPVFIMPHGMLDPYFQKAPERKWKALRNSVFWHLFEKSAVNNAEGLLFTCQRELELARETFSDYKPKKEMNVSYGVKPPPAKIPEHIVYFKKKYGIEESEPYWLFLSRIHSKKGIDLLLESYEELRMDRALPKLVVAGPLDKAYAQGLKAKYAYENIIFTDLLQGDEKWAALYGADFFILPSHQENFGIAIVEALACGTPVAITTKVNIYEEIQNADAGLIFEDTKASTTDCLKNIAAISEDRLLEMRKNASNCYALNYQPNAAAEKFINVIKILND